MPLPWIKVCFGWIGGKRTGKWAFEGIVGRALREKRIYKDQWMKAGKTKYKPWRFIVDTAGEISIASLLICLVSGVVLAVPYDISSPYQSITKFIIANPYAALFRNLHYWSAQAFLLFTLIHMVDYLRQKAETELRKGIWLRLILSVAIIFFVMLSGFILKGDAESMQAYRILSSLMMSLPFIGETTARFILGSEDNLQIVYVHHIATASIFIGLIIFEHLRRIWTSWLTILTVLAVTSIIGLLVSAPLHDSINPILKGPWYFLGLQELLHYMNQPVWSWGIALFLFLTLLYLPRLRSSWVPIARWFLFVFAGVYLVFSILGFCFRGQAWEWIWPWENDQLSLINPYKVGRISFAEADTLDWNQLNKSDQQRSESCLVCHSGMQGFSPSHDPDAIGCFVCHLGNPFSPNKDVSHKGMLKVPGNLGHAVLSCGSVNCHPEITERVSKSIMTTLSGMITIDRYVFGESDTLDALVHIMDLKNSAADNHFRDLCASCHLGNKKDFYGPQDMTQLGGGCNACHLEYSPDALEALLQWRESDYSDKAFPKVHPRLTIDMPDEKCFGCHSRSGRISTNFEGWHETTMHAEEAEGDDSLRILDDKRVFTFIQEDVHHAAGMRCVDCHLSWELMGDGNLYAHKEEQSRIRCEDCHYYGEPQLLEGNDADFDVKRIARLRNLDLSSSKMLKTQNGQYGIYNTALDNDGNVSLWTKADKKYHPLKSPGKNCSKGTVHDKLDCASCHTSWAPTCIGCHNSYDPKLEGYDLFENKYVEGAWVEYVGKFLSDVPTLGVRFSAEGKRYVTAVPGMILSVDKGSFSGEEDAVEYHRLFSPVSAHTIQKGSLACRTCHNNPLVLGFGRGELNFSMDSVEGSWEFFPLYANRKEDGLPEDAWTGFLDGRAGGATRSDLRALNVEEQQKMLRVGACLYCHEEGSRVMKQSLRDFETVLKNRSSQCRPR